MRYKFNDQAKLTFTSLTDCTPRKPVFGGVTGPESERERGYRKRLTAPLQRDDALLTKASGRAEHMLRSVLDHPLTAIVVIHTVHQHTLETPPANRQNQRVIRLKNTPVPAMTLQA